MRHIERWRAVAAAVAVGVAAAACGGGPSTSDGTITLLHGITGPDEQAALQAAIDAFEEETGNTVEVEVSPDFDTVIITRVTGGNPPDVALYPQPGVLSRLADRGDVVPLADVGVDVDALEQELTEGSLDPATFEDEVYGVVTKVNVKSLLWYAAAPLEDAGYEVPESLEELVELTDALAEDLGDRRSAAPWCIGMESGGDTGWVATDWIEDLVLRLHGPDVYDAWVAGELPFDSPEIREAFELLERIWFGEGQVVGGTTGILLTPFLEANDPMFEEEPRCFLHKQAGFIAGLFPEEAELGTDVAMTYFPALEGADDRPVVFGGDTAAVHRDDPVAGEFVAFLVSEAGQEAWLSQDGAGAVSVREDVDTDLYPTEELVLQAEILQDAETARFDASDEMPGEIGTGAFWTEVVAWLAGAQDLDQTLQRIDDRWPER
ncbi:carbohydrate ABC transporter substrate-binding protein [Nitriliruptoraceae bacterium ZYF776]|nr:carbohydrate ABC transporter substrate-binding protein [Profundirhabdus halotolerans]